MAEPSTSSGSVFSTEDTIVAIATPPGRGGIGVVRVSGTAAHDVAKTLITRREPLEPRQATFTTARTQASTATMGEAERVESTRADALDEIVVTYFPGPHSYTGEDVVELSAHGSPVVLQTIVANALKAGARAAEPGEFTLRAFLRGRIDLTQAEAVADLIEAVTPLQARAAFDQLQGTLTQAIRAIDATLFDLIARLEASVDFPDEGYHFVEAHALTADIDVVRGRIASLLADARRGRLVRDGFHVVIVGEPNVGKSSLFNALVGAPRAIVTDVPGTTRDLVTETIDLEGFRVTLVDTAGLRETLDAVESEGVRRSVGAVSVADLTIVVRDGSVRSNGDGEDKLTVDNKRLIVSNKSDIPAASSWADALQVSAVTGQGLDCLRRRIIEALDVGFRRDPPAITNIRHVALLERADAALADAREALARDRTLSEEFVLADLQRARAALEEITGRRAPEDVLAHIFSRFCIGK